MNALSVDNAKRRAEAAKARVESTEMSLRERNSLLEDARTQGHPEAIRIGEGYVAIAKRQLEHERRVAKAYLQLSKGEIVR